MKLRPIDLTGESPRRNQAGLYHLADNVTDDQFDKAIDEAREEKNLSRANVVRKINSQPTKLTGSARLDRIAERAAEGALASQIADELGHTTEYVRKLARNNDIDLVADRLTRGTRRTIDQGEVVEHLAITLTACTDSMKMLTADELCGPELESWVSALSEAVTSLNRLWSRIRKDMTHDREQA